MGGGSPWSEEVWLVDTTNADNANANGDGAVFGIPQKSLLVESGLIVTSTETTTAELRFDITHLGTRGDGDAGIITFPASNAQGKAIYETRTDLLSAGDLITAQVTSPSTGSKIYHPYLRLKPYVESGANQSGKTAG